MDLPAILSEIPLLAELDRKTIKRLAEQGKQRTYEAGEPIVNQGDPASAIYFLLQGRVRVEHEADGQEREHASGRDTSYGVLQQLGHGCGSVEDHRRLT